jgi:hypothetical protein
MDRPLGRNEGTRLAVSSRRRAAEEFVEAVESPRGGWEMRYSVSHFMGRGGGRLGELLDEPGTGVESGSFPVVGNGTAAEFFQDGLAASHAGFEAEQGKVEGGLVEARL